MTMTDPIADMLCRIRNANTAMHDKVQLPGSKLKEGLAAILAREGYIAGYRCSPGSNRAGTVIEIDMKYTNSRERVIKGVRRISKPGLRVYAQADKVPRVLGGLGVAILSTSQGLMTDREARRKHVGGEVLCYVW
jgi:SSU ribosomal protein S8P